MRMTFNIDFSDVYVVSYYRYSTVQYTRSSWPPYRRNGNTVWHFSVVEPRRVLGAAKINTFSQWLCPRISGAVFS